MKERKNGLKIIIDTPDVLVTNYIAIASERREVISGRVRDFQKCEDASIFMNKAYMPLIPQDFSVQYCNGIISARIEKIFLIASAAYLFVTRKTVNTKWELIVDRYNRLKENYQDILDASDLEDAFGHDEMISTYQNRLNNYKKTITGIWILFIVLVTIIAVIYSFDVGYWGRLLMQFLTRSK
jgi:hypothetical protein